MNARSESIASPTSADWRMSSTPSDDSTMSWTSRSIRFEPVSPEDRDLLARQVVLVEQPVPHRVVDVVVDVRDAVDEPHDLPLERLGLALARVREDPVADLVREVERARDPQRLLVVTKAPTESLLHGVVERVLARRARTACGPCRARARSPPSDPRSAAAPARRRARSPSSRACGSCASGSDRPRGR